MSVFNAQSRFGARTHTQLEDGRCHECLAGEQTLSFSFSVFLYMSICDFGGPLSFKKPPLEPTPKARQASQRREQNTQKNFKPLRKPARKCRRQKKARQKFKRPPNKALPATCLSKESHPRLASKKVAAPSCGWGCPAAVGLGPAGVATCRPPRAPPNPAPGSCGSASRRTSTRRLRREASPWGETKKGNTRWLLCSFLLPSLCDLRFEEGNLVWWF